MNTRLPGFRGEYLWEFQIAERRIVALADAFPADCYEWRPDRTARSTSEVLVHIAAGNFALLGMLGLEAASEFYGKLEAEIAPRMMSIIAKNDSLEKATTDKPAVIALLKRSLTATRIAFTETSDAELERQDEFFGEHTTVRRVYMRALSHLHEHMGQLIAYTRAIGMQAPWAGWRESGRKIIDHGEST